MNVSSRPAWVVYVVSFRLARLSGGWEWGDRNEKQFAVATLGGSQEAIIRICAWGLDSNRRGAYV